MDDFFCSITVPGLQLVYFSKIFSAVSFQDISASLSMSVQSFKPAFFMNEPCSALRPNRGIFPRYVSKNTWSLPEMIHTVLEGSLQRSFRWFSSVGVGWASAGLLTIGVKVPLFFGYRSISEFVFFGWKNLHHNQTKTGAFECSCKHWAARRYLAALSTVGSYKWKRFFSGNVTIDGKKAHKKKNFFSKVFQSEQPLVGDF